MPSCCILHALSCLKTILECAGYKETNRKQTQKKIKSRYPGYTWMSNIKSPTFLFSAGILALKLEYLDFNAISITIKF